MRVLHQGFNRWVSSALAIMAAIPTHTVTCTVTRKGRPMTIPLAERLRTATRELHREAERAGLMRALVRGQLSRGDYVGLLRNLHAVYAALEAGLTRHAQHPQLAPLHQPALTRLAPLTCDLELLHGPAWAQAVPLQAAATAYVAHLEALALTQPQLLAAHAYVRYLGDLSGGQVLARVVAQALQLAPGHGVAFYDFGPPGQVAALAAQLRRGLDQIAPDAAAADALVDEACAAFTRHRELFEQLERPAMLH
jgi:heme oxygenase